MTLPPIATRQIGDITVSLYSTTEDYLFTVTVKGKTASVGYKRNVSAKLRYTVYDGDPAFFRKLSTTAFHNVELCVWGCLQEAENKERLF
ncbi:hypothetical protein [Burkholderia pseudomallei]|uniref:hypothetical protein n=1 Tax=Burkholderia pseudomallei TaxID=28450 RepID=UPI000F15B40A|nr:hypothetical protein [Burkholderia pseudomallei]CAJ3483245.1 Uncharacterised protein [Burkholderia pseudomallei]CAJ4171802.1 Uncharacterised protein [Burkholderia pseudomallei]CAJ4613683.1 Uncharacterised protein [Burkholderia pseudomallei]CAJ5595925.1 Uncharacterised protein [Burkholderia pseudomallei]CAJ6082709.1 Uncharacterised protein [Burkholderia pseudomallei]